MSVLNFSPSWEHCRNYSMVHGLSDTRLVLDRNANVTMVGVMAPVITWLSIRMDDSARSMCPTLRWKTHGSDLRNIADYRRLSIGLLT
jgi:hypothetical protein